jgi:hypothetical protein
MKTVATTNHDRVRIEKVTPDMAIEWLEQYLYERQRPLRKTHVTFLAEEMTKGKFIQNTQIRFAEISDEEGTQLALVDGQHRLAAVINSNVPQSFVVLVSPATQDETADMYGSLDIGMHRTPNDILRAKKLENELGMTPTHVGHLWAAVSFLLNGCYRRGRQRHNDEIIAGIKLYAPYANEFWDIIRGAPKFNYGIKRPTTIAMAILTLRFGKDKDKIRSFWSGCANDSGLIDGDAAKVVFRHLTTTNIIAGKHMNTIVSPAFSARIIQECFNRYMKGTEIKYIPKTIDVGLPIKMKDVPLHETGEWFR